MTFLSFKQALGLGAAIVVLSAGGAFAADTLDSNTTLMSGPGDNFKTIGKLQAGQDVAVSTQQNSWCRITAPNRGWIPCSDITGLTTADITPVAPAATWSGYDFSTDPYLGPEAGGFHANSDPSHNGNKKSGSH
ncbi:MAG TPA: hypothetical protein VHZ56_12875 [Devosia sp.]|nr:hypothetical protein [Devosia sp.]